ncbi:MAG: hypothetical protein WC749_07680 [Dehalococcoidia bacterium]
MLTNQDAGKLAYIDIDIVFKDFIRSRTWESIKERLPAVEIFTDNNLTGLRIRPSSSGNAHIELAFERELTVLDNLCVRAWLNDDRFRLRLDLVRYLKTNSPKRINRLWSGKWKKIDYKFEMRLCENWQKVELSFMPAAREAWFLKQATKTMQTSATITEDPTDATVDQQEKEDREAFEAWSREDVHKDDGIFPDERSIQPPLQDQQPGCKDPHPQQNNQSAGDVQVLLPL